MIRATSTSRATNTRMLAVMTGYVAYVIAVSTLIDSLDHRPSALLCGLLALPAAGAVGYAVVWKFHSVNSRDGLERHVQLEALAAAFLITMLGVLTYGLLEAFADLPRLSMWFVWGCGMGSWGVASIALARKYR